MLIEKVLLLLCIIATFSSALETSQPCALRAINDGHVCVCTEHYCDTLDVPEKMASHQYILTMTSKSGERFNYTIGEFQVHDSMDAENVNQRDKIVGVRIDRNRVHQKIVGFGASFTGSVSYLLDKMSPNLRSHIYTGYYTNTTGSGFSLLRMPIGGVDFDLEPWQYNELPVNDTALTNITELHPYDKRRIALLKELMNVTKNPTIKIAAAAWSAPRWMKLEPRWDGQNGNQLRHEYYQAWADFHVKFLELMRQAGISIWSISSGNEPNFSNHLPFISMNWNAADQATWITKYLGPTLRKSEFADIEMVTGDDNRNTMLDWLHAMNEAQSDVMDFVTTIGIHGYFDTVSSADILDRLVQLYNKNILYTEMCFGTTGPVSNTGAPLGSWAHADELINMLLENLMHQMSGYIDWNMVLDHTGGPNYMGNMLDAAMIVNANFTEIYRQPTFYAMAQFSRFVTPGAQRITHELNCAGDGNCIEALKTVSFRRTDDKIVVILYNNSTCEAINVRVTDDTKGEAIFQLQPKTLGTLLFNA